MSKQKVRKKIKGLNSTEFLFLAVCHISWYYGYIINHYGNITVPFIRVHVLRNEKVLQINEIGLKSYRKY